MIFRLKSYFQQIAFFFANIIKNFIKNSKLHIKFMKSNFFVPLFVDLALKPQTSKFPKDIENLSKFVVFAFFKNLKFSLFLLILTYLLWISSLMAS